MIRNARNCLVHRDVAGAVTDDFKLHADGQTRVPSIEIDFRARLSSVAPYRSSMAGVVKTLCDSFEMITLHMCAEEHPAFCGPPMMIAPLSDDHKQGVACAVRL